MPVLLATARGGATAGQVLESVSQASLQAALAPVLASDVVLVSDGGRAYPGCARRLGVQHEAVNVSAGQRVRGSYHIQTVNNRHQQWKEFLEPFRGVATKYLDSYLRWYQQVGLVREASPRTCLVASMTPTVRESCPRAHNSVRANSCVTKANVKSGAKLRVESMACGGTSQGPVSPVKTPTIPLCRGPTHRIRTDVCRIEQGGRRPPG